MLVHLHSINCIMCTVKKDFSNNAKLIFLINLDDYIGLQELYASASTLPDNLEKSLIESEAPNPNASHDIMKLMVTYPSLK